MTAIVGKVAMIELDYENDLVTTHAGVPFTGVAWEKMANGVHSELVFVDGLQHGKSVDFFPNGTLMRTAEFMFNTQHGVSEEFDESGRKISSEKFEYGILVSRDIFGNAGIAIRSENLIEHDETLVNLLERYRAQYQWDLGDDATVPRSEADGVGT